VEFTPAEKGTIRKWLEISLKLEFRSGLGHPLEGFIEHQMYGLDMERIIPARNALENDKPRQDLTREEFGTLTRLADVWDEGQLAALDKSSETTSGFWRRTATQR
jgi:hypothetical protein